MDQYAKVIAVTATPDFVDLYGDPSKTYKPVKGDRGYMELSDAQAAQTAGTALVLVENTPFGVEQTLAAPVAPVAPKVNPPNAVTAGAPGSFTPGNADIPADLVALIGLAIGHGPAWTAGEYVDLGDGSKAYWDGATFAVGTAP